MRKYTVIEALTLSSGVIGLVHAQAEPRAPSLRPLEVDEKAKTGRYEVIAPVQFKAGEILWVDGDLTKALATRLQEAGGRPLAAKPPPERADKADAGLRAELKAMAKQLDEAKAELAELRIKAKAWDDVQEELKALRAFPAEIEALPKDLFGQVNAAIEANRAAAAPKA